MSATGFRKSRQTGLLVGLVLLVVCMFPLLIAVGWLPPPAGIMAVGLVLTGLFWRIRTHLASVMLVFVTVLLVSVIATHPLPKLRADRAEGRDRDRLSRAWVASGGFNQDLPIAVHLVFDEMMSPGAMSDDLPGGAETRELIRAFGEEHAFRVFDSVYSRSFFSPESLQNLMGAEYLGRSHRTSLEEPWFAQNAYFSEMARRGYRTVVFQNDLMDFCEDQNVDLCDTFHTFDTAGAIGIDERNQRARLWQTLVRAYQPSLTSQLGQRLLSSIYGLGSHEVDLLGAAGRHDLMVFPDAFDRLTAFIAAAPRGSHVFAYFMVPHSPYLLSESCIVSGDATDVGYYLSRFPPTDRERKRRQFYDSYLAQFRCVQAKLDDLMTLIGSSPKFRDAVIIIHGDHGSRISIGNILEDQTRRDFIDNYAAFFAVRSPAVPPGIDCDFVSLPEIFRRVMGPDGPREARRGAPLPVFVKSRATETAVAEAPMPRFGCAPVG